MRARKWEQVYQELGLYQGCKLDGEGPAEANAHVKKIVELAGKALPKQVRAETNLARTVQTIARAQLHGSVNREAAKTLMQIVHREALVRRVHGAQAQARVKLSRKEYIRQMETLVNKALRAAIAEALS